jgi:hypothetical protein
LAEFDDEIDALYGLPLEEFVPARDALAKRLRADKRRDAADAVKALRKPSVAAWAANQVLRARPDERSALLEAGDALRAAQERLLAGKGDAAAARAAGEAERSAVGDLVAAARGLARAGGFPSEDVVNRVRETLHAAATDDDARAEVEAARLSREHRPAAFGGLEGFAAAPAKPKRKAPAAKRGKAGAEPAGKAAAERDAEAERERKAAERDRRRAAQAELKAARAAERDAARDRRQAERAVEAAERDLAAAREGLERAEAAQDAAAQRRAAAEEAV